MNIEQIKDQGGFVYLATPYSKYRGGLDAAYMAACRAAGLLVGQGIKVYSPIAHSHGVALHGGIDAYDHSIWLPQCMPVMNAASCIVVATLPGWKESYGVQFEIRWFEDHDKPVFYFNPETGECTRT